MCIDTQGKTVFKCMDNKSIAKYAFFLCLSRKEVLMSLFFVDKKTIPPSHAQKHELLRYVVRYDLLEICRYSVCVIYQTSNLIPVSLLVDRVAKCNSSRR